MVPRIQPYPNTDRDTHAMGAVETPLGPDASQRATPEPLRRDACAAMGVDSRWARRQAAEGRGTTPVTGRCGWRHARSDRYGAPRRRGRGRRRGPRAPAGWSRSHGRHEERAPSGHPHRRGPRGGRRPPWNRGSGPRVSRQSSTAPRGPRGIDPDGASTDRRTCWFPVRQRMEAGSGIEPLYEALQASA